MAAQELPPFKYLPESPSQSSSSKPLYQEPETESFTGFFENLGTGALNFAKGLGELALFPAKVGLQGAREWYDFLAGNRNNIAEDFTPDALKEIAEGSGRFAVDVVKASWEDLKKWQNPLQRIYDDPFAAGLDAATLAALSGGALKTAAKGAAAAGAKETAYSLAKTGNLLSNFPRSIVKPVADSPILRKIRSLPKMEGLLSSLHLTPESSWVSKKFDNIVLKQRAVNTDRDLRDLLSLMKYLPEEDVAENIFKVAAEAADESILTSSLSKDFAVKLRQLVDEQTKLKVERGVITQQQADLAPLVLLRNQMARQKLAKVAQERAISPKDIEQLIYLSESNVRDATTLATVAALQKSGALQKIVGVKVAKDFPKYANPRVALLNTIAPLRTIIDSVAMSRLQRAESLIQKKIAQITKSYKEAEDIVSGAFTDKSQSLQYIFGVKFPVHHELTYDQMLARRDRLFDLEKRIFRKQQDLRRLQVDYEDAKASAIEGLLSEPIISEKKYHQSLVHHDRLDALFNKISKEIVKITENLSSGVQVAPISGVPFKSVMYRVESPGAPPTHGRFFGFDSALAEGYRRGDRVLKTEIVYLKNPLVTKNHRTLIEDIARANPAFREAVIADSHLLLLKYEKKVEELKAKARLAKDAVEIKRLKSELDEAITDKLEHFYRAADIRLEQWAKEHGFDGIIATESRDLVTFSKTYPVENLKRAYDLHQKALPALQKALGMTQRALVDLPPIEGVYNLLNRLGVKPFYLPLIHQQHINVADSFIPREFRDVKLAFQKARTGAPGFIRDLRVIVPIMRIQFRQFEAVNEFLYQLERQPWMKNVSEDIRLGRYTPTEGTVLASFDHSFRPFYKDLFATEKRFAEKIKDAADEVGGEALKKAISDSLDLDLQQILEMSVKKRGPGKVFEIPKGVADVLTKTVGTSNPFWKVVFDAPIDLLRVTALQLNPLWYLGNLYGNILFSAIAGLNPFSYLRGNRARFERIVPRELRDLIENKLNTSFSQAERARRGLTSLWPFRSLSKFNEMIEDFSRRTFFVDAITKEAFKRRLITVAESMFGSDDLIRAKLEPLWKEAAVRGQTYQDVVLRLADKSAVTGAIQQTNKALFDYLNLHPLERNLIRRAIPFWSFMKNTHLLMARLPFERPLLAQSAVAVWRHKVAQAAADAVNDEDLPSYLEGHVPVGYAEDGKMIFASIRALNPFASAGALLDPQKLITSANPLIKATIEHFGGRDLWSKQELKNNERIWDYAGRKYTVRIKDGRTILERTVPGENSFLVRFFKQYPQIRMLSQLVDSASENADGSPVTTPWTDEYGNRQYPDPMGMAILKVAGINLKKHDQEDFERRKRRAKVNFIKKALSQARKAPEAYRNFMVDAVRNVADGDYEIEGYDF